MRRNCLVRLLMWGLVSCLTLGVTACGENAGQGNASSTEAESTQTVGSGDSQKGNNSGNESYAGGIGAESDQEIQSGQLENSQQEIGKEQENDVQKSESGADSGADNGQENAQGVAEVKPTPKPVPVLPEAQLEVPVLFSQQSGVYAESFELVLTSEEAGKIYYTLDGSDPADSDTAILYENPIQITDRSTDVNVVSAVDPVLFSGNYNYAHDSGYKFECKISAPEDAAVDKCTTVRAVLKKEDGTYDYAGAGTYFIGTPEEHIKGLAESCAAAGQPLAVISISMDYEDLFDSEKGIYVKGDTFQDDLGKYLTGGKKLKDGEQARSLDANYKQRGRDWEREASLVMFEVLPEGTVEVLNQNCGIRIQGNYSRSDLQKGLRLYARKDYGDNNFRYAVFGGDYRNDEGEVMDKFKNLVLRNGGNCAFTSKFNDAFWQSLVRDTAVETKQSRPCVVYLNGEYWGLYVLEEDYSDDYFEDLHGVNKDDVVVYKGDAESYAIGYSLDEGEIPEGEEVNYYFRDLIAFFDSHSDLKSQQDYDEFVKLVDPQSVMDYFAVECWINNKWDWPGKNWSMWKTISVDEDNTYGDGRWRFVFYDVEFGGVSGSSDAKTNTIKEDNYKPKGLLDMDTDNPAVLCFAYLMTNDNFRADFCDKLLGLSEGMLEKEAALARLEEFEDIYGPLYEQFFERYPGTGSTKEALHGGYATPRCIRDFLEKRADYIQKMVDYCEKILG
ncbi:MAG: CotH kinase family protein [Lachnospiraceae bacterium]|nr:CotH kinase family protein [Lachnospiraceae bacterium]